MSRSKNPSIGFCLACDDVRNEIGGKHTIVGVYSGDMVVDDMPNTLPVALFMELIPSSIAEHILKVRVMFGGAPVCELKGSLQITSATAFYLGTPQLLVPCASEGEIVFQVAFDDDDTWITVQKIRVILRNSASVTS